MDARAIIERLGRKAIADRLHVGLTAVGNAASDNMFPAAWYAAIKDMCDEVGQECPTFVFNFKGLSREAAE